MTKLLVVCPTRARAARCREMLNSFYRTKNDGTDILCYVDEQDPQVRQYAELLGETPSVFGKRKTIIRVWNDAAREWPAKFYAEINDDHLYVTQDWDTKLIAAIQAHGGHGMAYGYTKNLPTATVVSASCIKALGWWMLPELLHQFCDDVNKDLYGAAGMLYHVPEVIIEHRHPAYGLADWDEGYRAVYSPQVHKHDSDLYHQWRKERMTADVETLKKLRQ